jgi:hypothetical protein
VWNLASWHGLQAVVSVFSEQQREQRTQTEAMAELSEQSFRAVTVKERMLKPRNLSREERSTAKLVHEWFCTGLFTQSLTRGSLLELGRTD